MPEETEKPVWVWCGNSAPHPMHGNCPGVHGPNQSRHDEYFWIDTPVYIEHVHPQDGFGVRNEQEKRSEHD